jgi:hypothetical protein
MKYYHRKKRLPIVINIKEFLYTKTIPKFPEIINNMITINQNSTYKGGSRNNPGFGNRKKKS